MTDKPSGYVYILEVADIDLPVCKIGMTTRDPISRCHEINKSSTGDFIWAVAHSITVDDCRELEKLVHYKLDPLRQKKREFFNLCADDAYKAVISIIESQSDIKIMEEFDSKNSSKIKIHRKKKNNNNYPVRSFSAEYATLLQSFCEVLGVKGRPFGQFNKPFFGMSDGNEGVQWNISIHPQANNIHIGVNLEGKMYKDWPISRLIKSEVITPKLPRIIQTLDAPDEIFLTFWRDAWQVASRPEIEEKYIGGRPFGLNELTGEKWQSILNEALECLDKEHDYRKRNTQNVTMVKKDGKNLTRTMQVSPHLTIWSPLIISEKVEDSIRNKINELTCIYRWMMQMS
ncbi:GIY-YIG nuclease family protein [Rahnella sp. PCH160]|uniref:GIY-YIG nuclease family protein n=1 Tax=Rahnella sp. PCH160 TaxID=3447928 RepID=UPI0039FD73BF